MGLFSFFKVKADDESSTFEAAEPNPGGGPRCLTGRLTGFFLIPVETTDEDFIDMLSEPASEDVSELKIDGITASGTWT